MLVCPPPTHMFTPSLCSVSHPTTDGACKGARRQEKHSYATQRAAADAYDAHTRAIFDDQPKYRQDLMRRHVNFCTLCGGFRNPKKCAPELLEDMVLCACEDGDADASAWGDDGGGSV